MQVVFVLGSGVDPRPYVVDNELVGQVLGAFGPDDVGDFFERFGMGLRFDDMGP